MACSSFSIETGNPHSKQKQTKQPRQKRNKKEKKKKKRESCDCFLYNSASHLPDYVPGIFIALPNRGNDWYHILYSRFTRVNF